MRRAAPAQAPVRSPVLPRRPLLFALGLALTVLVFVAWAWPFAPHTVDDAWITFRYSRQWALGHGPYFNPGEHVEGYSNFLLMLIMTPVIAWGGAGAALPVAKAIGLAAAVLSVLGTGILARRAAGRTEWADAAGVAAAGLLALVPGFGYHAFSGLETTLYAGLLVWGMLGLISARERSQWLGGLALAAAAISRPEAPAVFALAWLVVAGRRMALHVRGARKSGPAPAVEDARWRPLLIVGVVVAAAIVWQIVFRRLAYDGEWVPNTYFAKIGGAGDRVRYVSDALGSVCLGPVGLLLAAVGIALGRAPFAWWAAAIVGTFGSLLPLVTGGDWMEGSRLTMPYVPLLAAAIACSWGRLVTTVLRRGAVTNAILLLTLAAAFAYHRESHDELASRAAVETEGARTGHAALAEWLGRHSKPGDTIVLMDIGEIGYKCIDRRILDITGLTDRHIAKSPGVFLDKNFDLRYVFDQAPEFVVLTLIHKGSSMAPVDPEERLRPFSTMELRLATDAAFGRYVRVLDPAGTTGIEALRRRFGADAMFPYATPGFRYVLAVYARRSEP